MLDYEYSLNGKWNLYIEENCKCSDYSEKITTESELINRGLVPINGTVPGNFELDMQAAGLIEDPYFGTRVLKLQQLENRHLWYCREFDYDSTNNDNTYLKFDGIDTFADIYLNGVLIGSADNMFISHEFSAHSLVNGKNRLTVHIKPTCIEARKYHFDFDVSLCFKYNYPSMMTRKAAHTFGWDIAPRIVSGGMWRGVSVIRKKPDRIEDIFIDTVSVENNEAILSGYYRLELSGDFASEYSLEITGECGDSCFKISEERLWHNQKKFSVNLKEPKLWWPRFMGEANLYAVTAVLRRNGIVLDEHSFKLGIRKIKLNRSDVVGNESSFGFEVNGLPMFVMGTNWVPLDAFHSNDASRLDKALEMLADINCNAVRCWGGNVYEDHAFFDFCDSNGIIVWQDFAMGCATYPLNEVFLSKFKTEVECVVRKLRQHPSLALWAGDNECDIAYAYWEEIKSNPAYNKATREIIPEVLRRLDPFREYLPSSPYVSEAAFESGLEDILPEEHLWGPRDYFKGDFYINSKAHFASETGYHGAPAVESIKKFISEDKCWPILNDECYVHSACMELGDDALYAYRNPLMLNQVKVLFGKEPESLEEFVTLSQISQAEADKFFIERFRSGKWKRSGIIWWNLVDCWPQFSDAVVDYYYNKKLAYSFIKRSQQPVALMFKEPEKGELKLIAANEYPDKVNIRYTVKDMKTGETVMGSDADVNGLSNFVLGCIPYNENQVNYYYIEWQAEGSHGINHYISGKAPYDPREYTELMSRYSLL